MLTVCRLCDGDDKFVGSSNRKKFQLYFTLSDNCDFIVVVFSLVCERIGVEKAPETKRREKQKKRRRKVEKIGMISCVVLATTARKQQIYL